MDRLPTSFIQARLSSFFGHRCEIAVRSRAASCRSSKKLWRGLCFAAIRPSVKIRRGLSQYAWRRDCLQRESPRDSGGHMLTLMATRCAFRKESTKRRPLEGQTGQILASCSTAASWRQRHRVKVMTVIEGSIIVDFFLARSCLTT